MIDRERSEQSLDGIRRKGKGDDPRECVADSAGTAHHDIRDGQQTGGPAERVGDLPYQIGAGYGWTIADDESIARLHWEPERRDDGPGQVADGHRAALVA